MKNILSLILLSLLMSVGYAQSKSDCDITDAKTDTVSSHEGTYIVEYTICQATGRYIEAMVSDINGKYEFYFTYKYDGKGHVKNVTFWTVKLLDKGFANDTKIGELSIEKDSQKMIMKTGYSMTVEFAKLLAGL
jgi:hypothetical protein